jgi:mono/diheme cytochrome c family protein
MHVVIAALCGVALLGGLRAGVAVSAQQKTQWDGVYAEAQAKRGLELYTEKCAACHGADMAGGEQAPSLAGPEFMASWDGLTAKDLLERMQLSMPQTNPGSLTVAQNADILSAMLQKGGFPAGSDELPADKKALEGIKLSASKP